MEDSFQTLQKNVILHLTFASYGNACHFIGYFPLTVSNFILNSNISHAYFPLKENFEIALTTKLKI
jgi:hypothetical protein